MKDLEKILAHLPPELVEKIKDREKSTESIYSAVREAERLNGVPGNLQGQDCPICRNKGIVYLEKGKTVVSRECECMAIRRSQEQIRRSGLSQIMREYRFDNYQILEEWQQKFRAGALQYLKDHDHKWFFAGGQPGVGKTHICTALAAQFLKKGIAARYMLWKEESVMLKAAVKDGEEYARLVNPLKRVAVLYIDDLFKGGKDEFGQKRQPTIGDINLAFDIFNYRYVNNLPTIISTERTIEEILEIDEATGSRIYQRSREYCFSFDTDRTKNFRLHTRGASAVGTSCTCGEHVARLRRARHERGSEEI